MRYYTAVVHQEGDSAFGLSFPDLPGCFAAAEDWEEIPEKVSEALDLYFEDSETVEPRPLNVLRALPEVQEALGEGATLMAVPYIAPDGTQVRANISLDRGLLRAIDETAQARRMSRSAFLAALARREITGV
ncbi:ribbon-helix-helix protein, CopG family [Cereibacter changlensis]|uniref:Ribbon-helix-helix protein, CopG family n=1 Tax=Cereibacter changlensis TaxID=402884 RepID=A0A4U0YWW1_9RHOB|nr:type II toxin-antitoxin system HicB family antitoxin [Cereibacter changlensis]TKA95106.1 ribbon-helix-helix protein, CopG family [Cereibacter changlensis]